MLNAVSLLASNDATHPALGVTATVTAATIYGGDWATWQVTVTNTGDDPLTGVTLDDSNGHDYGPPFDLDMGASRGFFYTTIPGASVTNEVTAVGTDSGGGTVSDSDQATVTVINPNIQVIVTVRPVDDFDPEMIYGGQPVEWYIIVTNWGDVPLTGVTLVDSHGHDYGLPFDLMPGEGVSFDYITFPLDDVTNVVFATGDDPLDNPVSGQGSDTMAVINPGILVNVAPVPDTVYKGDLVTWVVTVTNAGDDPLVDTALSDSNEHGYGESFYLDLGANAGFSYTTNPWADTTLDVAGRGRDSLGGLVEDNDSASVNVIDPGIQVEVLAAAHTIYGGSAATWTVTVTNTGDDPLADVTLSDDTAHDFATFPLAVGASEVITYATLLTAPVDNDVTATGLDSLNGTVTDQDNDGVNVIYPRLQVEQTVTPTTVHRGEPVTWEIAVSNNGDNPLTNVSVNDGNGHVYGPAFDLGVGERKAFSYTTALSERVANLATAVGYDSLGGEVNAGATADAQVLDPAIQIVKTASAAAVLEGDAVQWTITVYNRGNAVLDGVVVNDSNGMIFGPSSLAACDGDDGGGADQVTWTYEGYPLHDTVNVATASGVDALGKRVADEDRASVMVNLLGDSDADGQPDHLAFEDDGDGIPYAEECPGGPPCLDSDEDGIPDCLDSDDDGDGIPSDDECPGGPPCQDTDEDGIPDYLDDDDDGDGIPSDDECPGGPLCQDTDEDGIPDYLDDDDDGDGIPSADECSDPQDCEDTDDDGIPDYLDDDDDGDGIPTVDECADGASCVDSDGDGVPDYLDPDDDGDGIPTVDECADGASCVDSDGDGVPDYLDLDSDGDGIPDADEWSAGADDPLAGCSADDPVCFGNDTDGDGLPNYQDPDSDGDGVPDSEESLQDSDGDGIPDWLDPHHPDVNRDECYVYLSLVMGGR